MAVNVGHKAAIGSLKVRSPAFFFTNIIPLSLVITRMGFHKLSISVHLSAQDI